MSSKSDQIYIGSTKSKHRYSEHTSRYRSGIYHYSSRVLFDLGIEHCSFHILEEFECETYEEQLEKEQSYLDTFKDVIINKRRARRHPDSNKIIYQKNKDYYLKYRQDNLERYNILEKERQKIYINCDSCCKQIKKRNISRHNKQKTHLSNTFKKINN
tara:strand:- start:2484 stop:2957 length:474 start_codon:yes stop_codon:yes gene_type:complete